MALLRDVWRREEGGFVRSYTLATPTHYSSPPKGSHADTISLANLAVNVLKPDNNISPSPAQYVVKECREE